MFIRLFSWIGIALDCAFTCYCLAAGLYLIGEFIEEYNVFARKSLVITIAVLSVDHAIFLLEMNILCNMYSMGCLGIYYVFINDFPQLTPVALRTLTVLGITNHISWYRIFACKNDSWIKVMKYIVVGFNRLFDDTGAELQWPLECHHQTNAFKVNKLPPRRSITKGYVHFGGIFKFHDCIRKHGPNLQITCRIIQAVCDQLDHIAIALHFKEGIT